MKRESFVRNAQGSLQRVLQSFAPGAVALFLLGFMGLVGTPEKAEGQERARIVGQITAEGTGAPLGQVQVHLTGTNLGTLSNQAGRFTVLNVPPGEYRLQAQRIGLSTVTREINLSAGETLELNFQMGSEALGLDEIVVTGVAGTARRREIGSTINQINVGEIADRPLAATDMLAGAAPGIEVSRAGGEVGQGSRIQLRGQNSLSMTNQPIIYIDGIRMMAGGMPQTAAPDFRAGRGSNITASPLDQLNPNDIERIEVIKGSAATTLYGTEASAGVIQIFTRSGSAGAPVWTLETQQGTAWAREFGVKGSERVEEHANYNYMTPYLRSGPLGLGAGDWGTAHTQNYFASVRGGGENLRYFASAMMEDQVGVLPLDEAERWTVRGNFTFTPMDNLQVDWNTEYSSNWMKNTPSGNNAQGLTLNVFRQERNYFGSGDFDQIVRLLEWDTQQELETFTTGATATYSPTENLTNRFTVGYDLRTQEARNLRPHGFVAFPQGGLLNNTFSNRILSFDYVSTYRFDLGQNIRSSLSWGGQATGEEKRTVEAWGEDFPGASAPTVNSAAVTLGFEEREEVWTAGFFLQNVFDLQDRYFVTLGARVDGNSAFGEGFGLQTYPKAQATWVVSDEEFWQERGDLRLRVAWGQSGRAPGTFDAVRTWSPVSLGGEPAFVPQNVGNPDLGPEVSTEFEVGMEASWFDGRIRPDINYFHQITSDALLQVPQLASTGFSSSQLENIGEIKNQGVEFTLETNPVRRADWHWDLNFHVSWQQNEITDLGGRPETPTLQEGLPVRPMVTWLVTNPDEVAPPQFEQDHFYGPTHPTRNMGVNTSLRVPGGVVLAARGEYQGGHYVNNGVFSIGRSVRSPLCFPHYVDPLNSIALKEETTALWRARCTPSFGRGYVWDASFFKLRAVSATIPMDFAFPDAVNNASLTIAMTNAFTWLKEMPFADPEMLGNQGINTETSGFNERMPTPIGLRASLRISF